MGWGRKNITETEAACWLETNWQQACDPNPKWNKKIPRKRRGQKQPQTKFPRAEHNITTSIDHQSDKEPGGGSAFYAAADRRWCGPGGAGV